MISVTICPPGDLVLAAEWAALARRASPNVFMNPAVLAVADRTGFARVLMLLAWKETAAGKTLVGVWGLRCRRPLPLGPRVLDAVPYAYAFSSSPVIDPECVDDVWPAFLAAVRNRKDLPNVIVAESFDEEAPGSAALMAVLSGRGQAPLALTRHGRPVATRDFGVKRSGSTRKKLRQDWNRLGALGAVDVSNERDPIAVRAALETFLALEHASWKGTEGTALLCDEADAAFVRGMVAALADQAAASVALLRVDGKAIAAQVLMYCGATAYTWKIGYDAAYGKFSPGALLIDKITDDLFAAPGIDAIDSCSVETSFMGQLWTGRRSLVDLVIDVGSGRSLGLKLEVARRRGYRALRNLRNRLRGVMRARRPEPLAPVVLPPRAA